MSRGEADPEEKEVRIRRILVALDASLHSLEALEAAAELAARWKAELLGLFVEDIDLLRLAGAPAATVFLYPAASEEPLSLLRMESELRALAERARRELARVAGHAHVSWSFRTVRGRLPAEILLAAAQADLLSLGGAGWSMKSGRRLGSTARAAMAGARSSLLLTQYRISLALPVLVVHDGSEGAENATRFAGRLAEAHGNRLTVLLLSPSGRPDPKLEAEITRLFATEHLQLRFRTIKASDKADFLRAVRSEEGGILVMSGQSPLLQEEIVEKLMRETDKPLFIVGKGLDWAPL